MSKMEDALKQQYKFHLQIGLWISFNPALWMCVIKQLYILTGMTYLLFVLKNFS